MATLIATGCGLGKANEELPEAVRRFRASVAQHEYAEVIRIGQVLLDSMDARDRLGPRDLQSLYAHVGRSYLELQMFDSGRVYLNLAIDEFERSSSSVENRMSVLRDLAYSYTMEGKYDIGVSILRNAILGCREDSSLADLRRDMRIELSSIYIMAHLYDSSRILLEHEMSSWGERPPKEISSAYEVVENLLTTYLHSETESLGVELARDQIRIYYEATPRDYQKEARLLGWLSLFLAYQGDYINALQEASYGLAVLDSGGIADREVSSVLYQRIAEIETELKRYTVATAHYDSAIAILKRGAQIDEPRVNELSAERDSVRTIIRR